MLYKYFQKNNYEDFSSGKVIYQKAGFPNYPVRLAGEIFSRCLEYSGKNKVTLYDPCCGCGYMVTVLGFLFNEKIISIHASDVSPDAVEISEKNLSLLTIGGIEKRKNELTSFVENYGKDSHRDALLSLNRLRELHKHEIAINCFTADVLASRSLDKRNFTADIVMTDVPYGGLSVWQNENDLSVEPDETENRDQPDMQNGQSTPESQIDILLDTIKPVLGPHSVISISYDNRNKISNDAYKTIDMIRTGRRKIEFLKLGKL